MLFFNSGLLFLNPVGGNQATDPSPIAVGTLQDISLSVDQAVKELMGSYNVPDDVAPGRQKVTGKFTFGQVDINLFNQMMFAGTTTTGVQMINAAEAHTVPASTPWTVTVTNSAQFATDLGVQYQGGQNFLKVASAPAAGQYSVAAGVYTFSTADASKAVQISYTSTSTSGNTLTVSRQTMGWGSVCELFLENSYQAVGNGYHIFSARISKLNLPSKLEDYTKAEMDFEAYANSAGKIFEIYQISA